MPSSVNLMTLNAEAMASLVEGFGWPRYRAAQVLRWLYQHRVTDVAAMTDLSKADRVCLARESHIGVMTAEPVRTSADGTQKYIFRLDDGQEIESVVIPDGGSGRIDVPAFAGAGGTPSRSNARLTLCLSTQVGCTLDCTFCLTGRMGLHRNLKPHEIVGQVLAIQEALTADRPLTNLVFMGMGEPLANLDAVEEAVRRLTDQQWGVGFSPRRITLSTAGLATRIRRVAEMGVNLAVSLNATTNAQRDRLMPAVNKAYSLDTLVKACRAFPLKPRRRLTFEYVLIGGENDTEQDAIRLVKLVRGIRCKVNLIPFNEFPQSPFRRPADEIVHRFQSVLTRAGVDAFIRKSKGRDILGACGQLGTVSTPISLVNPVRSGPMRPRPVLSTDGPARGIATRHRYVSS